MYTIEIKHNIESAHRFYRAMTSPKCRHIHGHSWVITLTLSAPKLNDDGMVMEFGTLKRRWRHWLDTHLDHALMLHHRDPMAHAIQSVESEARLFLFPHDPTTEHVAEFLMGQARRLILEIEQETLGLNGRGSSIQVAKVHVQETHVNAASYVPES